MLSTQLESQKRCSTGGSLLYNNKRTKSILCVCVCANSKFLQSLAKLLKFFFVNQSLSFPTKKVIHPSKALLCLISGILSVYSDRIDPNKWKGMEKKKRKIYTDPLNLNYATRMPSADHLTVSVWDA